MKKVTVILSMFVFGISAKSFAQKVVFQDIHNTKMQSKPPVRPGSSKVAMPADKDSNAILVGLLLPAVQNNSVPAQPNKAEVKPIIKNNPTTPKASDVKVFNGNTGAETQLLLPAVQKVREAAQH